MAFPAVVAGSIFTFSLSLGDYIAVQIVGGTTQLLGNVIYATSARPTTCPSPRPCRPSRSSVMFVYLAVVTPTGALEQL